MKKRLQGFIAGALVGVMIAGGTALAVSTTTLYDVITSGVSIVMDGNKLIPRDANGNVVEPMIYNGTTYLPVRAISNAVGKAVYWDGPNYTVYLGDMDGQLEYPTVQIEDMTSVADKVSKVSSALTDNYGNRYSRAIYNYGYTAYTHEYLLNMKYSHFKGTLYIPEGETYDGSVTLSVIADGKTLYTSPEMTKTSRPVNVDVNVTGYNDVKIQFSSGNSYHKVTLCLADAGFYQ